MKKSVSVFEVVNYIILAFIGFVSVYPFLYTLTISLSTTAEAVRAGFHLYPREISLTAYKMVLSNSNIYIGYLNTITRTVLGTAVTVLISAMMAYPLSKKDMPHVKLFTTLLIITMIFDSGIVPNYLLIKSLKLLNNRLVYVLPGIVAAYNIIIMKSYFNSLPESISESAKIDGANEAVILFRIIMPLSVPVLATVALWVAVGHWNSWLDGVLYVTDNGKQLLQVFLQRVITQNQADKMQSGWMSADIRSYNAETIKSATIIITILPILMLYPFLQKYFVKGIALGAVKG